MLCTEVQHADRASIMELTFVGSTTKSKDSKEASTTSMDEVTSSTQETFTGGNFDVLCA